MFSKRTMLEHHLRYNHFPPIPLAASWAVVLESVLNRVDGMGEIFEDFEISNLPGTSRKAMASELIEAFHLHELVMFTADEDFQVEPEDVFGEAEVR